MRESKEAASSSLPSSSSAGGAAASGSSGFSYEDYEGAVDDIGSGELLIIWKHLMAGSYCDPKDTFSVLQEESPIFENDVKDVILQHILPKLKNEERHQKLSQYRIAVSHRGHDTSGFDQPAKDDFVFDWLGEDEDDEEVSFLVVILCPVITANASESLFYLTSMYPDADIDAVVDTAYEFLVEDLERGTRPGAHLMCFLLRYFTWQEISDTTARTRLARQRQWAEWEEEVGGGEDAELIVCVAYEMGRRPRDIAGEVRDILAKQSRGEVAALNAQVASLSSQVASLTSEMKEMRSTMAQQQGSVMALLGQVVNKLSGPAAHAPVAPTPEVAAKPKKILYSISGEALEPGPKLLNDSSPISPMGKMGKTLPPWDAPLAEQHAQQPLHVMRGEVIYDNPNVFADAALGAQRGAAVLAQPGAAALKQAAQPKEEQMFRHYRESLREASASPSRKARNSPYVTSPTGKARSASTHRHLIANEREATSPMSIGAP